MNKNLYDKIRKIILLETIWLRHYIGQVKDLKDPLKKGRVNVVVYDLGFGDPSKGFWCACRDKKGIITPKINDWVEIYFMNGDRNRPVYMGIANEMKDMLPKSYDKKPTTHVLFESPEDKIRIVYDEKANALEIGKTGLEKAARENDATLSNSTLDATFFTFLTTHVHPTAAVGPPSPPTPPHPTSLTGKINGGSDQTKIGDK